MRRSPRSCSVRRRNSTGDRRYRWRGGAQAPYPSSISSATRPASRQGLDIEYDPNRSARIAPSPMRGREAIHPAAGLKVGDTVLRRQRRILTGNCLTEEHSAGTMVHNVELKPGKGGQMARSAGAACRWGRRRRLRVGEDARRGKSARFTRMPRTIGQVGNIESRERAIGKAGRSQLDGQERRTVRGVAMNPVDHPLGGGEARPRRPHP